MNKILTRIIQCGVGIGMHFLPWKEPTVYKGVGMIRMLPTALKTADIKRVLIVTDQGIKQSGVLEKVTEQFSNRNLTYEVFDTVEPNPDEDTIEKIVDLYIKSGSEGLIGVGGGSVIDATKVASVLVNHPNKKPRDFEGMFKVRGKTAYTLMIPTTAGTGSEVTLAAVVSSSTEQRKYTIMEAKLFPNAAILAPEVIASLPPRLTAETGMDALTHAVESFISRTHTKQSQRDGLNAVKLVNQYLEQSYNNPSDLEARLGMLEASYYAGRAFTRAYVGNIHAISHALTAYYNEPHGRTNATVMPIILKMYGKSVHEKLAKLADAIHLTEVERADEEKARAFIGWIENMNKKFEIPKNIPAIDDRHMEDLISHADKEANPLYPVPMIFNRGEFREAFLRVRGNG